MTNDEKAKAYDMALEAARKELGVDRKEWEVVQRVLHNIFPQLRESEDERIRKAIIEFIKQGSISGSLRSCLGISEEQMIAYLEKQKEQKPIDYPYLPGWRKNRDNNKPELKRSVLMLTTHGVAEGEWLGEKWCQYRWSCELKDGEVLYWIHLSDLERLEKEGEEKQKEQKSAEWSEEDERRIDAICELLENTSAIHPNYSRRKLIIWLKSLRPSWKPNDQDELMKLKYAGTSTKLD